MNQKECCKHIQELRAANPVIATLNFTRIILDDSPDIVVECKDGKRVGIEVVRCPVSSIRSNDDKNRMQVSSNIKTAIDAYKKLLIKRNEPIIIWLYLNPKIFSVSSNISQKKFIDNFIEEIERHRRNDEIFKRYHEGQQDKDICKKFNEINRCGEFEYKYVDSIECSTSHVGPNVVDMTLNLCGDVKYSDIEPIILKKEKKLTEYKAQSKNNDIDEYWLVINVPYEEQMWIDYYQQEKDIVSGYDKIYITGWDDIFIAMT